MYFIGHRCFTKSFFVIFENWISKNVSIIFSSSVTSLPQKTTGGAGAGEETASGGHGEGEGKDHDEQKS